MTTNAPVVPPVSSSSILPPNPPKKRRFQVTLLSVIFAIALLISIARMAELLSHSSPTSPSPQPTNLVSSPTNIITGTPTPPFSPSPTVGATASALPMSWTEYKNTSYFPGLGVSLKFPYGWKVNYRKTPGIINPPPNFLTSIDFDFLPANEKVDPGAEGWMGWGTLSISIYSHIYSIGEWIAVIFPTDKSKLVPLADGTIGNVPAYLISPRGNLPPEDPLISVFTPRDVVVGNRYIYEFSFSKNGRGEYKTVIKRGIFPFFHFD